MKQTKRKPATERRREIASAVLRLIGERGASSLTTSAIAGVVGVTPGALFRHFASLEEILAAAVDLAIEVVEGTFPPADLPPLERLSRLVLSRIETIRETPGLAWLLLSNQVYLTVPGPAVERLRELVQRSKAFLLQALRDGIADGSLRSDLKPEIQLILFSGTVHALVGARGVHQDAPNTPPQPAEVVAALLELLAVPPGISSN